MQLKWTDLAGTDLEKIEAHIAQENSPSVAIDVVMNIIDSSHLVLSEHPRAGRHGRLKNTRELVINGLPFIVIYREYILQIASKYYVFFMMLSNGPTQIKNKLFVESTKLVVRLVR